MGIAAACVSRNACAAARPIERERMKRHPLTSLPARWMPEIWLFSGERLQNSQLRVAACQPVGGN